ncbi:toll/interleukin-1 receptor domain-containing protein [Chthoniobacter flavus]
MPSTQRSSSPTVFLSHSSHDKPFVRRLQHDFEKAEIPVWLDEQEIGLGESISRSIEVGLEKSDYLLLVHSTHSAGSEWVKREVEAAINMQVNHSGIAVLTAVMDDAPLPILLKDRIFADFRKSYEAGRDFLMRFFKREASSVVCNLSSGDVPPGTVGMQLPGGGDDCPTRLSRLTHRELRKRMQQRLRRKDVIVAWYDLFEEQMDDQLPGKPIDLCLIELLDRCKQRQLTKDLLEILCEDWPHVDQS